MHKKGNQFNPFDSGIADENWECVQESMPIFEGIPHFITTVNAQAKRARWQLMISEVHMIECRLI